MQIITRYLFREIIGPFTFGVLIFTVLMLGFALVPLVQQPQLGGSAIFHLIVFSIPDNLALAFPMGILLGTLFALGRLSGHSEIVAMRAGGMTGIRLMFPFVFFGLIASFVSLYLTLQLVPLAHRASSYEWMRARGQVRIDILRQQVLPLEFENNQLKRLIYIDEFNLDKLEIHGALIQEFRAGRLQTTAQADAMIWEKGAWHVQHGIINTYREDGSMVRIVIRDGRTDYQPLLPKPEKLAKTLSAPSDPRDMTWKQYRAMIAQRARRGEDVRALLVDLYTRLAIPFACLALAIVGTPLGVQSHRSGAAISFGLSILVLTLYFFLLSFSQVLGRSGVLTPTIAAWSANIILFAAGTVLFVRRIK